MSVLELLGFEVADARRALENSGVDYDELSSAINKKNLADRRVARQGRSRKLGAWSPLSIGVAENCQARPG